MSPWYLFLPLDSSEQHVKGKNHVTLQAMESYLYYYGEFRLHYFVVIPLMKLLV